MVGRAASDTRVEKHHPGYRQDDLSCRSRLAHGALLAERFSGRSATLLCTGRLLYNGHMAKLFLSLLVALTAFAQTPSIEQSLGMKSVSGAQISPDGRYVAYTVQQANWDEDEFVQQIWIAMICHRRALPTHQREEIEPAPQVVARFQAPGLCIRPRRQAPDLRDLPARRRAATAHHRRERRRAVRVVARWHGHRLHLHRPGLQSQERSQRKIRRLRNRRRRLRHDASLAGQGAGRNPRRPQAAAQARGRSPKETSSASEHFPGRPIRSASPSARSAIRTSARPAPSSSTCWTWPTSTSRSCSTSGGPNGNPQWSPDGRQIAFNDLQRRSVLLLRQPRIAIIPASGRRAESPDRQVR